MPVIALLTRHQKAACVAPALAPLGYSVQEVTDFDTDTLGTFSGEVERTLSPKACALEKARLACDRSGHALGLGSEGSFGGGPYPGLLNWDQEILCFYEASSGRAIYAIAQGTCPVASIHPKSRADLLGALEQHPGQHWIARPAGGLKKALSAEQVIALYDAWDAPDLPVFEPDLRALYCPSRQAMISAAAEDLAQRLSSRCPSCDSPDFVVKAQRLGLPCRWCGGETNALKERVTRCDVCSAERIDPVPEPDADPVHCPLCNP